MLRRCHSMSLDFQKRRRPEQCSYASIRQKRRADSLQLASHCSDDQHTDQPSDSRKPLKPIEPMSPLSLDNGQVIIRLDIDMSTSSERELLANVGQMAILDSIDSDMKETAVESSEGLANSNGPQIPLFRQDGLPNNEFAHPDTPRRISEEIQILIREQQKVSGMRVQLSEMRSDLDKRRTAQIFQWSDSLQGIKSMLSSVPLEHTNTDAIRVQLRSLETINQYSDDYLLRENEYQSFQRHLEEEENSLQQRQSHVAELLQSFSLRSLAAEPHFKFSRSGSYQQAQDMWAMTEDDSDTVGEIRMYQERLGELSLEYAETTGREASFALVNMSLDEGSQYFLDNYESQRLELEQMISEKMDAAASIREQCEKEGLLLAENVQERVETELDMDIRESLPRERDLLWLSELDENNTFFEPADSKGFSMYYFINRWILHQLRHSTSQILRYKSNPRLQDLKMDGDDLSEWAMELWFQDDGRSKMVSLLHTPMGSSK
uniref:Uncharacterized protein n=2 Tax=Talaromyces marneffei PM1 TaxID=1077442 RepID=A0A093UR69_TALMA